MIKYILPRPIAVFMVLISLLVLGIVSMKLMPVSLMPDVDIPKITVRYSAEGLTASEIENTILKQVRSSVMQTSNVADIRSEATDGSATIYIDYEYGTNIDLTFIDVNEKLDRIAEYLPDISRPQVIKASATDIPVFYIDIILNDTLQQESDKLKLTDEFVELSSFANMVIRKRLEQLSGIAMVDMSGNVNREIVIIPDYKKLQAHSIGTFDIENAIKSNNLNIGNITVQDGYYRYSINIGNRLYDVSDIENIYLSINNKIIQIKDIAEVVKQPQYISGRTFFNGNSSVSLAVIKQSGAQMNELKEDVDKLIKMMEYDYPLLSFNISRNQTRLLDYSINNLKQSLVYGGLLAIVVMFFFLRDFKSPLLIVASIPTSLLVSVLILYLIGISINIISLSGLILGVGMMIDNAIIVIDNINQHRVKTGNIAKSCVLGTNEVFSPLLSSVLTTCSVFIPLIFMPGMAGALFYDQAISIATGLIVSLLVSVTLLPVLYNLLYKKQEYKESPFLLKLNIINYEKAYHKGLLWCMRNMRWVIGGIVVMIIGAVVLFKLLPKEQFPGYSHNDVILYIDWNEKISLNENIRRCNNLVNENNPLIKKHTYFSGIQNFVLNSHNLSEESQSVIYIESGTHNDLKKLEADLKQQLNNDYNSIKYSFQPVDNIFEKMFKSDAPYFQARLKATKDMGVDYLTYLKSVLNDMSVELNDENISVTSEQIRTVFYVNTEKLLLYDINYSALIKTLQIAFNENEIIVLNNGSDFIPVILGDKTETLLSLINNLTVRNRNGKEIRISNLIDVKKESGLKKIYAGVEGEYYPVEINKIESEKEINSVINKIKGLLNDNNRFEVGFSGLYFKNKEMINSMGVILLISLLLLYFILAAQFESLLLPVIVLIEIPVDIFGSFLLLKLFGESINLMSLIGIIVMSGIVINDSILKIDTINRMRRTDTPLLKSIITAGNRRLKPILMTSITTILALFPFLFMRGMGAELQKPLAVSVIGGMFVGTIVSLYFIPLSYYVIDKYLNGNKENKK